MSATSPFDDRALLHDHRPVADRADDGQVVGMKSRTTLVARRNPVNSSRICASTERSRAGTGS